MHPFRRLFQISFFLCEFNLTWLESINADLNNNTFFLSRTALPRYLGCLRSCLFHFIRIKNVLVAVICFVSFYQLLACRYFKCYFNYCVSQRKKIILIDICCATHVICGTKNLFMWFNILSIFDILFEIAKVSTTSTPILLLSTVKS